jgi:hypothetical protein
MRLTFVDCLLTRVEQRSSKNERGNNRFHAVGDLAVSSVVTSSKQWYVSLAASAYCFKDRDRIASPRRSISPRSRDYSPAKSVRFFPLFSSFCGLCVALRVLRLTLYVPGIDHRSVNMIVGTATTNVAKIAASN